MRIIPVLLATAAALMTPVGALAQQAAAPAASPQLTAFSLPPLPYAVNALEPAIDAETMTIHHDRHHKAYVDTLNKAVSETPALAGQTLEQIVARAGTLPTIVRNNAGGRWNHSFFWKTMAPPAEAGQPLAALKAAGTSRFGSGWVWLIVGADGKLAITSTPNQDNPLMDVAEFKGTPILGNDMWEHAYYLKYQNRRADYLDGWCQVVNWKTVSERFAAATRR